MERFNKFNDNKFQMIPKNSLLIYFLVYVDQGIFVNVFINKKFLQIRNKERRKAQNLVDFEREYECLVFYKGKIF